MFSDATRFDDRILLYADLLGFAEATASMSAEVADNLVNLVTNFAAMTGAYAEQITQDGPNTWTVSTDLEVSTFSDHLVASYPLSKIQAPNSRHSWDDAQSRWLRVLSQFQYLAAQLAKQALEIGFLIRGGMSLGKLYHTKGVILGPAMIEAYSLESKTAVYPRIAVSPNLIATYAGPNFDFFVQDSDGLEYLNYFPAVMPTQIPAANQDQIADWFRLQLQIAKDKRDRLRTAGRLGEYAKWAWFSAKLEHHLSTAFPSTDHLEHLPN